MASQVTYCQFTLPRTAYLQPLHVRPLAYDEGVAEQPSLVLHT